MSEQDKVVKALEAQGLSAVNAERLADAFQNRYSDYRAYHAAHFVGFPGIHVRTEGDERIFVCSFCGEEFKESQSMECDRR